MALESEIVSISGVDVDLAQFGNRQRPTLLYLHGGLGRDQSTPFLQELAQQYRVIAPHHPGVGASSLFATEVMPRLSEIKMPENRYGEMAERVSAVEGHNS